MIIQLDRAARKVRQEAERRARGLREAVRGTGRELELIVHLGVGKSLASGLVDRLSRRRIRHLSAQRHTASGVVGGKGIGVRIGRHDLTRRQPGAGNVATGLHLGRQRVVLRGPRGAGDIQRLGPHDHPPLRKSRQVVETALDTRDQIVRRTGGDAQPVVDFHVGKALGHGRTDPVAGFRIRREARQTHAGAVEIGCNFIGIDRGGPHRDGVPLLRACGDFLRGIVLVQARGGHVHEERVAT